MILTRTPLRIPLAGGGTDIPSYSREHGGLLLSAAINRYVYIAVFESLADGRTHLIGQNPETVNDVSEIKHDLAREALRLTGQAGGITISSFSEIPPGVGLGGSAAFTVGLLNALYKLDGKDVAQAKLAEDAYLIEYDVLGRRIGKQDQYIASLGGIKQLCIDTSGSVATTTIDLRPDTVERLTSNLLIFYTGVTRDAADILADQVNLFEKQDLESVEMMHGIKRVGLEIRAALLAGDLPSFGQLLGEHWNLKRRFSHKISNSKVDRWYECALREGATGGKLMGAGGGGFLLLYCEPDRQAGVLNALRRQGLRNMPFEFDFAGTKVLPI